MSASSAGWRRRSRGRGRTAAGVLEKVTLAAEEAGGEESEAIRLMTLHNAKGLEFDVVFLVGLEDGLLPHSRSVDSPHEIEEERRLFYVGLTRARERVFLSSPGGETCSVSYRDAVPSRFLYDLPASLVRRTDGGAAGAVAAGKGILRRHGAGSPRDRVPGAALRDGEPPARPRKVRHPVFGEGKIEAIDGEGNDRKIIARFRSTG